MTQTLRSRRTGAAMGSRGASPFRYSAAITGTGEAQAIQEFIGRRFVRQIDPCSRMGRRLLISGQVSLWCDPVVRGERLPVSDVLGRLRQRVQNEMAESGTPPTWDRNCRQRLQVIENWQAFYRSDPVAGN
ncbi:MAG: hypothetical protein V3S01_01720 [Dehalococcoidia bacterium]